MIKEIFEWFKSLSPKRQAEFKERAWKTPKTKQDYQSKICWLNTKLLRGGSNSIRANHVNRAKNFCKEKIKLLECN